MTPDPLGESLFMLGLQVVKRINQRLEGEDLKVPLWLTITIAKSVQEVLLAAREEGGVDAFLELEGSIQ